MRSCSFARAISSAGRCGPDACSAGAGCWAGRPRAAFGRGRDDVPVRGSVTLRLPNVLQPAQQCCLAGFVVGEVDLLQVERELQFRERAENPALVKELGVDLLLDHAGQPQQPLERAEHRRGEYASEDAHAGHSAQLTTMLTKLYGGTGPTYLNTSRSLHSSSSRCTASSTRGPFRRSTRKAAFSTMRSLTILFVRVL